MKNYTDILPEDNAYSDKLRRSECELSEIFRDVPMRAVHGDARFDNVIIGERCTVIDLDTAMIGYAAFDYGDMIRSVCTDRNALHRSEELTSGFLRGVGDALSQRERESLYYGVLRVTGELAARYFADTLSGGHYFGKTPRQCMARAESLMSQLEMFTSEENALKALL